MACLCVVWISSGAVQACALPDMRTDTAPAPPGGGPVQVKTAIVVLDVLNVDDVAQQIDVDLGISMIWRDPRLRGLEGCRFAVSQVWHPDTILRNSATVNTARKNAQDQVRVGPDGEVTYRQRVFGDISTYHDLRDFPFDAHQFEISFLPVDQGIGTLEFLPDPANTWMADRLNITGWDVHGLTLDAETVKLREAGEDLSLLTLTISAEREASYYIFRIMLPLLFVVAMSWVIFWVPPRHFEFQIGLGATSMLTVIAFNLSVAGDLPPLGYLTVLDQILIWSIAIVFLAIAEALITGLHVVNGHEARAKRIDRVARVVFPGMLIGGWATLAGMGLR